MYYYFLEVKDKTFKIIRDATAEEHEVLNESIKKVATLYQHCRRLDIFYEAYDDLIELINDCNRQLKPNKIQRSFSELLFEFRKFIDNWESDISKTFGKDSKEYDVFKKAQSFEYENHMEYRIMYRLRNYDQHCGNILTSINNSLDENQRVMKKVFMNRDKLIEQFDEWKKPELDYLGNQDENIEIKPYIEQLKISLTNILQKTLSIYYNEDLINACVRIIKIANEFEYEDYMELIENEKELDKAFFSQRTMRFSINSLMVPVCKEVLKNHIRNNSIVVQVFYYGEKYDNRLRDCCQAVDLEVAKKIYGKTEITIGNKKMIRILSCVSLDKPEILCVFADSRLGLLEAKKLVDEYKNILKALCKSN